MAESRKPVISVHDLAKNYGELKVLRKIDMDIYKGEVVSVIGPSGSGKSTFLRCLNYLEELTSGEIDIGGVSLKGIDEDKHNKKLNEKAAKVIRKNVGMVFQQFNLFNNMTVFDNCMAGVHKVKKRSKEYSTEICMKYLEKVGMAPYVKAKPHQLSGGMKQRVAIAGIIAMKPDCILLDEPTAMLDPHGRDEVMKTVKMLNEQGVTIVLITHYMEEAAQAQRVVVIDGGEVIMDNVPKKIFSNVETMKNLGLDVPQVTELCWELKRAGYDISTEIIHEDECVQKLYEMLK